MWTSYRRDGFISRPASDVWRGHVWRGHSCPRFFIAPLVHVSALFAAGVNALD